ncbi:neuroblast differentiation-associated protein AHNAK-like [Macrobrachium nipponense]|uniref:neuroblast differentiation-associated protein AHNAK-like n=1 Tax=Macrobrachium nipponense TaxID=159736 RepID=UPI0030C8742B
MSFGLMVGHRTCYYYYYYAMLLRWWVGWLFVMVLAVVGAGGQNDGAPSDPSAADPGCSCDGAIVASVLVTFIVTLAACGIAYLVDRYCCKRGSRNSGGKKHDVDERAAYDNPHFQPDESSFDTPDSGAVSSSSGMGGSTASTTVLHNLSSGGGPEKGMSTLEKLVQAVRSGGSRSSRRAFDDSHLTEPWVVAVPLRGHDFTGLGFNISGNMRDGVFVKDVLHRGPASESGKISPGDRLLGLAVSTEHMVHEDALTLLSYASPYPVILLLEKHANGADKRLPSSTAGRPVHPFYRSQSIDDLTKIGKADMSRVRKAHLSGARMKHELSRPEGDDSRELKGKDDRAKARAGNKKVDAKLAKREAPERHSERAIDVPGVELSKPTSPSFKVEMPSVSVDKPDSKLKFGIKVLPDLTKRTSKSDLDLEAGGFHTEGTTLSASSPLEAEVNVESEVDKSSKKDKADGKSSDDKPPSGAKFGIKLPHLSVRADASDVTEKDTVVSKEQSTDERNISLASDISGIALSALGLTRGQGDQSKDSHEPKTDDEKQIAKGAFGFGFKGFGKDEESHITASDEEKAKTKGSIGVNIVPPEINSSFGDAKLNLSHDDGVNKNESESREAEGIALSYNAPDITLPFLNEGLEVEGRDIVGDLSADINAPEINLAASQGDSISAEMGVPKTGASLQFPSVDISMKKGRDNNDSDKEKDDKSEGNSGIGIKTSKFALPSMSLKFQGDKDKHSQKESKHGTDDDQTRLEGIKDVGDLHLDLQGPRISTPDADLGAEVALPAGEGSAEDHPEGKKNKKSKKDFGFGFKAPDFKLPSMGLKGKWDDSEEEDEHKESEKGKGKKSFGFGMKGHDVDLPSGSAKVNLDLGREQKDDGDVKKGEAESDSKDKKNSKESEDGKSKGGFEFGFKGPKVNFPSLNFRGDDSEKEDLDDDGHDENKKTKDVPKKGFSFNLKGPDITLPKLGFRKGDDEDEDQEQGDKGDNQEREYRITSSDILPKADVKISSKDKETDDSLDDDEEGSGRKSKEGFGISFGTPNISLPSLNLRGKKKGSDEENADAEDSKGRDGTKDSFSFGLKGPDVHLPTLALEGREEGSDREKLDTESPEGREKQKKSSGFGFKKLDINLPNIKLKGRKEGNDKGDTESDEENGRDKTMKGFNINLKGQRNNDEALVNKEFGYDAGRLEVTMPSIHIKDKPESRDKDESGGKGDSDNEDIEDQGEEGKLKKKSKDGMKFSLKGPDISLPKLNLKSRKENVKEADEHDSRKDLSKMELNLEGADVDLPSVDIKGKKNNHEEESDDDSNAKGNSKKGFKLEFKAPKVGFPSIDLKGRKRDDHGESIDHENQQGKEVPRRQYSFELEGPDVKLPSVNLDDDQDDMEDHESRDTNSDNKGKSRKGHVFSLQKPNISIPGMNLNARMEADDKGSDDDSRKDKDKEKTGKGFSLSNLIFKGQADSNQEDNSNDEDQEDATNKRKGFKFNTKGLDVNLPSINLKGRKEGKDDHSVDGDTHNSSDMSGKGISYDFHGPEVNLPHITLKGKKPRDGEDKLDDDDDDKKFLGELKMESDLRVLKDAEQSDDEDSENKKSKMGLNFGNFKLPTFSLRGHDKGDHERDVEYDHEEYRAKRGDQNVDDEEGGRFDKDDAHLSESKREFGIAFKGPRNLLPTVGFQRHGDEHEESKDDLKTTKKSYSAALKGPDVSLSTPSIEIQGSDVDEKGKGKSSKKGFGFGFKVPDITMPTLKSTVSDHDGKEISDEDADLKGKKEKRTFEMNVKHPEVKIPKLEGKVGAELSEKENTKSKRNDEDHREKTFKFKAPGLDLPSFKTEGKGEVDGEGDGDKSETDSKGGEKESRMPFDIGVKLPDFSLPSFSLKGKGDKTENSENSDDDMDGKIRIKDDNRRINKMDIEYETHNKMGREGSEAEEEDDNGKKSKNRKRFGFEISAPDISLPNMHVKAKGHPEPGLSDEEDEVSSKKGGEKKAKKRFNFGIKGPDFNFTSKSSTDNAEARKVDENSGSEAKDVKSRRALDLEFEGPDFDESSVNPLKSEFNEDFSGLDISLPKAQLRQGKLGINIQGSGDLDHDITKDESSVPDFTYSVKSREGRLNKQSKDHDLHLRGTDIKLPAVDLHNEYEFTADSEYNVKKKVPEIVAKGLDLHMPSVSIKQTDRGENSKEISKEGDNMSTSKFSLKDLKGKAGTQESIHYELNLKKDLSNEMDLDPSLVKSKYSATGIMLPNMNVNLQKSDVNVTLHKNADNESNIVAGRGIEVDLSEHDLHPGSLGIDNIPRIKGKQSKSQLEYLSYNVKSELPEADLDFKETDVSLPGMGIEVEAKKSKTSSHTQPEDEEGDSRFSPGFGVAFGFKGFKKHIDIDTVDKDQMNEEFSKHIDLASKEVSIKRQEIPDASLKPPRSPKNITVKDVNAPLHEISASYQGPDVHTKKMKTASYEGGLRANVKKDGDGERTTGKAKAEDDDEKSKNKNRFGLGFGFRGFGRSSDSEEDCKEPPSLTPDPDRPEVKEDKKKARSRMSFGFKGFSKSSDTEEENSEKVSGSPMDKDGDEEKPRTKSKSGLHFSFKGRNSKSSDSEDNNDQEKVGTDPQPESGHIKQKLKPNLSFGFKGKSRSYDMETGEGKSEMRSDSEGVEAEEKASLDTQGEDASRIKSQKGRSFAFKSRSAKNTSDSEGAEGEERVELDTHGGDEKVKEQKSKGIRLGFKGFKNLKGKIQTEISRMRHDSHSSDDEATREGTVNDHPDAPEGKRKKSSKKKKEKEKKNKKEWTEVIEISEENSHVLSVAAAAAKDNRRKRTEKTNTSSSSSSSSSSEDENEASTEVKKRKRNRGRSRQITTGVTEVNVKDYPDDGEVSEKVQVVKREVNIVLPQLEYSIEPSKTDDGEITSKRRAPAPPKEDLAKPVKKDNVIVKEVRMKSSQIPKNAIEVNEVVHRTVVERHIPMLSLHDVNSTASDSEGERGVIRSDLEPITSSTPKHPPIDSEELKRKAASLGDLSRLQTEPEVVNVILERAMSLDLTRAEATTSVEKVPRLNHPLRLQLPDSSATSIDEEEEASIMALRVDGGTGLRRAGQWGTLEEALQLRKFSSSSLAEAVSPRVYEPEGESVSHIEISGSTSVNETSSQWVTASETSKRSITLHKSDDESEDPPALPSTPAPLGGTTITLLDGDATILDGGVEVTPMRRREDVDVVVVQSGRPASKEKQVSSFSVQLCQVSPEQELTHVSKMITSSSSSSSRSSLSSDSEAEANMVPQEIKRGEGVTVTVAPRISSVDVSGTSYASLPPPVPPKPRSSRAQSPPELVVAHHEPAVVTVRENGAVVVSTDSLTHTENVTILPNSMEHVSIESVSMKPTISERVIVDSSENGNSLPSHLCHMEVASIPQKSFTQITVDGSGYTVSEGALSRTLIISTPSGPAVPSGPDSPPPTLQPPH